MKRASIAVTALLVLGLSGCSVIHSAEGITIYQMETEQGEEFYADVSITPGRLSDDTKRSLAVGEPLSEYEVELSNGTFYGFQSSENLEPKNYAYTYGTLTEIAEAHHLDLLASKFAVYPEGEKNLIVIYDSSSSQTVSIMGVDPEIGKDYWIETMDIYFSCGGHTDHSRFTLTGITDEADYVTYEICDGEEAHIMYDLSIGKGIVFVRTDGAVYRWELEGVGSMDDFYEFADSIDWIKGAE